MMIRRIGRIVLVEFDSLEIAKSFFKFLTDIKFKMEFWNFTKLETEN